jgi:hypothetical protein
MDRGVASVGDSAVINHSLCRLFRRGLMSRPVEFTMRLEDIARHSGAAFVPIAGTKLAITKVHRPRPGRVSDQLAYSLSTVLPSGLVSLMPHDRFVYTDWSYRYV